MIDPKIFERYSALRVPRYTSYPSAPNFSSDVGAEAYRGWLRELDGGTELSLYLHVPFCREMCWYCGCHTTVTRRRDPVERYVAALLSEIDAVASALPSRMTVRHLHFGGGSPTLLPPDDLKTVSAALRNRFDFAPEGEVAVEIDPRTLTPEFAAALGEIGATRASLGVQSFDSRVQQAINRVQSVGQTAQAVGQLRRNGIAGINFDLIYGLPLQTVESCLATAGQALTMRPSRLAVFGYAHVPDFKPHQRKIDQATLPTPEERHAQAEAIAGALIAAGYQQIGLDHFAMPDDPLSVAAASGRLHRNFQGYTVDACPVLIGLGTSAISRFPQGYVQNQTNIPLYEKAVQGGELPVFRGCRVSDEDTRRAAIIERLMCDYRADIRAVCEADLSQLEADGLLVRTGDIIEVTREARPLVRAVAAAFDQYLPQSTARHVTAV